MKLFVTGGTGFIGSHFLREAVQRGHRVAALRRSVPTESAKSDLAIEWIEGDLETCPHEAFADCDAFVHFAALGVSPKKAEWKALFRANVCESVALWHSAIQCGIRRFVICGSSVEYGRSGERYTEIPVDAPLEPTNGYGASKAAATIAAVGLAREYRLALRVLRPFQVFGEQQHEANFWPALRRAAHTGRDFPMTAGEQIRDFTPVSRVAEAFADALTRPDLVAGEPVIENVGTGVATTLLDFAQHWWKTWEARGRLLPGAMPYRDNEVMRYIPQLK